MQELERLSPTLVSIGRAMADGASSGQLGQGLGASIRLLVRRRAESVVGVIAHGVRQQSQGALTAARLDPAKVPILGGLPLLLYVVVFPNTNERHLAAADGVVWPVREGARPYRVFLERGSLQIVRSGR